MSFAERKNAPARLLTERQAVEYEALLTRAAEHEATLLACAMHRGAIAGRIVSELSADDFSNAEPRRVFEAIKGLSERSTRITPLAVVDWLRKRGDDDLVGFARELALGSPVLASAPHALEVIKEASARRAVLRAAREAVAAALNFECSDPLAVAYDVLGAANEKRSESRVMRYGDAYADAVRQIADAHEAAKAGRSLVPTSGWYDLDQAVTLGPGKMVVIAGRPGMGKSAFGAQIARHVAGSRPVLSVSLEMTRTELVGRDISAEHKLSSRDQLAGNVRGDDRWGELWGAADRHADLKLWIADPAGTTMAGIEATARHVAAQAGEPIGMLLIDYLGLVDSEGDGETARISAVSRAIKRLAMSLKCPVLVLAQLNRGVESRDNKRPMLSDLRQSGAIEQDADVVLFLYRDDYYNPSTDRRGVAEVLVAKNRGGASGVTVELYWKPSETRFASIAVPSHLGALEDE